MTIPRKSTAFRQSTYAPRKRLGWQGWIGATSDPNGRSFAGVPSKAIHMPVSTFLGGEDDDDASLDPGSKVVEAGGEGWHV